jgi:hypothetical protein
MSHCNEHDLRPLSSLRIWPPSLETGAPETFAL